MHVRIDVRQNRRALAGRGGAGRGGAGRGGAGRGSDIADQQQQQQQQHHGISLASKLRIGIMTKRCSDQWIFCQPVVLSVWAVGPQAEAAPKLFGGFEVL